MKEAMTLSAVQPITDERRVPDLSPGRLARVDRAERWADRLMLLAVWALALLWIAPLAYVFWVGLREPALALSPNPLHGWTLNNILTIWEEGGFARYYLNTTILVVGLSSVQVVLACLAAYAFARYRFPAHEFLFLVVLLQLLIFPEVLLPETFALVANMGLANTIPGIAIPYAASAFAIFLMRQAFKTVPKELVEAAEVEGASRLEILWKVYIPLARPTLLAFVLISVSFHWNNFLWPLVITRSPEVRPITVGIVRFLSPETGINFTALTAGTIITVLPLLVVFVLLQRQFIQSFLRSGIK